MSKKEKLNAIKEEIHQANLPLKDTSTNLVFGKGSENTPILFIGEAPGEKEDLQGVPFVGRAGQELNSLLNSINLSIDDVYIANVLKYRPPSNRDPNPEEIQKHAPFLIKQIEVIQPKVIATLGNYATKFVLAGFDEKRMKNIEGITKLHGKVKETDVNGSAVKVIPLYHPAAMLYNPQLRKDVESDFQTMGELLKNLK
jgi:DNA polymerase|tara:strand:- start:23 stop:619 length:597 start_codon:yes stop_codon:yes gene_type:complete